jgi:hypothetical protein
VICYCYNSGHILGLDHDDLVVTTYSGKVLCYTQESTSNVAHIGPKKSATAKDAAEAKAMRVITHLSVM